MGAARDSEPVPALLDGLSHRFRGVQSYLEDVLVQVDDQRGILARRLGGAGAEVGGGGPEGDAFAEFGDLDAFPVPRRQVREHECEVLRRQFQAEGSEMGGELILGKGKLRYRCGRHWKVAEATLVDPVLFHVI